MIPKRIKLKNGVAAPRINKEIQLTDALSSVIRDAGHELGRGPQHGD